MNILPDPKKSSQKGKEITKALFFLPEFSDNQTLPENVEKKISLSLALEKHSHKFKPNLENKRHEIELSFLKKLYLTGLSQEKKLVYQSNLNPKIELQLSQYIQKCEDARLNGLEEFEYFLAEQISQTELELQQQNQEFSFLIGLAKAHISTIPEDYRQLLSTSPWGIDPSVILDEYTQYSSGNAKIPPLIIISPPDIEYDKFPHPPSGLPKLGEIIQENLRRFLDEHYPKSDISRPIYLASDAWDNNKKRATNSTVLKGQKQIAAKLLFDLLKSIPVIILDSEIDNYNINLSIYCWDVGIDYLYQPIIDSFSYKNFLYAVAKQTAQQWDKRKSELLQQEISLENLLNETINQENEFNLHILHEENKFKELGFERLYDYQPTHGGVQKLSEYWSALYCLYASLASDAYYLNRYREMPKLPKLLQELTQNLSELESQSLIKIVVDYYHDLGDKLEAQTDNKSPELYLELAQALAKLSNKNLGKQQLEKSLSAFLKLRNLPLGINLFDNIGKIEEALELRERPYVDKVNQCLGDLSISRKIRLGDAYYKEGVKSYEAKRYESAIAYFQDAIAQGYVQAQIKLSRAEAALKVFEDQKLQRQTEARNLESQGDRCQNSGNDSEAIRFYEQAVNFGSTTAEAKLALLRNKKLTNSEEISEDVSDGGQEVTEELRGISADETLVNFQIATIETELVEPETREEEGKNLDLGNGVILKLVEIPSGSFKMQGDHQIKLKSFLIGQYPVTQKQYQEIMGNNPSNFKGDNKPVERVSWDEAVAFCEKLSEKTGQLVMLPSESQWEYAACAGTSKKLFCEDTEEQLNEYVWYVKISIAQTHPVGEKKPNPWGLYDMIGNVWEWCQDDWEPNYHTLPKDGSPFKKNGNRRARRGASWLNYPGYCNCHFRLWYNPDYKHNSIGFRVIVV